jgi:hypothetical protein
MYEIADSKNYPLTKYPYPLKNYPLLFHPICNKNICIPGAAIVTVT